MIHPLVLQRLMGVGKYSGVDMRGNGDSEGVMEDEYTQQELEDAVATINWLAAQNWCSGEV